MDIAQREPGLERSGDEPVPQGVRSDLLVDPRRLPLVAVHPDRMRLVVEAEPANMYRRGVLDQALLLGAAVEARHRAQTPGDRRPRPAPGLEIAGERLDVSW